MARTTKAVPLPDANYLRERLRYSPLSGELRWKARPRSDFSTDHQWNALNARCAGKLAGTPGKWGHIGVCIGYHRFLAHRIIWKMMTGDDPEHGIDHKDGNGANNRWKNLRKATQAQNNHNARCRTSKTGLKGVKIVVRPSGLIRYMARLCEKGRSIYLGVFDTADKAHAAYCREARNRRGAFFRAG